MVGRRERPEAAAAGEAERHQQLVGEVLDAALALAYLCYGGFTAASYALYMDLTHPALGGTQFSAFMEAALALNDVFADQIAALGLNAPVVRTCDYDPS